MDLRDNPGPEVWGPSAGSQAPQPVPLRRPGDNITACHLVSPCWGAETPLVTAAPPCWHASTPGTCSEALHEPPLCSPSRKPVLGHYKPNTPAVLVENGTGSDRQVSGTSPASALLATGSGTRVPQAAPRAATCPPPPTGAAPGPQLWGSPVEPGPPGPPWGPAVHQSSHRRPPLRLLLLGCPQDDWLQPDGRVLGPG